jgi:hypothetical protein
MLSPIVFPSITYGLILQNRLGHCDPITAWLTFGKLPENPVINPSSSTQVVIPSGRNKFLNSVIVNPITTTDLSVTPSAEEQVFSDGPYGTVTVAATA